MSKNNNFSYEGFRRKNSLNSTQLQKNTSATELTYLKFRHNEHLTEVQNLSMQLDSLSKRSLSSRSLCEERSKLSHSATNFPKVEEEVTQNRFFNPTRKEEMISHPNLQMQQSFEKPIGRERKEKVSTSAVFNKFQTIEEDHYTNEQQENVDEIEPVTFKCKPTQKLGGQKKGTHKLVNTKNLVQPIAKKTNLIQKVDVMGGSKREKIKLELNELDKMQKELDNKRSVRESNQTKSNTNLNILKRGKEPNTPNLKESAKLVKATIPQTETKHFSDHRSKPMKTSGNIMSATKMSQSKYDIKLQDEEKEECIPTRMLSEKQKTCLMLRVDNLRQIIEKNDICSQNLQEISNYFNKIEKLLTK